MFRNHIQQRLAWKIPTILTTGSANDDACTDGSIEEEAIETTGTTGSTTSEDVNHHQNVNHTALENDNENDENVYGSYTPKNLDRMLLLSSMNGDTSLSQQQQKQQPSVPVPKPLPNGTFHRHRTISDGSDGLLQQAILSSPNGNTNGDKENQTTIPQQQHSHPSSPMFHRSLHINHNNPTTIDTLNLNNINTYTENYSDASLLQSPKHHLFPNTTDHHHSMFFENSTKDNHTNHIASSCTTPQSSASTISPRRTILSNYTNNNNSNGNGSTNVPHFLNSPRFNNNHWSFRSEENETKEIIVPTSNTEVLQTNSITTTTECGPLSVVVPVDVVVSKSSSPVVGSDSTDETVERLPPMIISNDTTKHDKPTTITTTTIIRPSDQDETKNDIINEVETFQIHNGSDHPKIIASNVVEKSSESPSLVSIPSSVVVTIPQQQQVNEATIIPFHVITKIPQNVVGNNNHAAVKEKDVTMTSFSAKNDAHSIDFTWAYAVWKQHGLIMTTTTATNKESKRESNDKVPVNPLTTLDVNNQRKIEATGSTNHHPFIITKSSDTSKNSNKPWNIDWKNNSNNIKASNTDSKFSNILDQWKTKTEEQSFDSPGSCTILQRANNNNNNSIHTKRYTPKPRTLMYPDDANTTSKQKCSNGSLVTTSPNCTKQRGVATSHPAASIPIRERNDGPDNVDVVSSSPIPKSQAWKLKSARQIRVQQEQDIIQQPAKTVLLRTWIPNTTATTKMSDRSIMTTSNSNANKQCHEQQIKSPPAVVETVCTKRSKSTPRGITRTTSARHIPDRYENSMRVVQSVQPNMRRSCLDIGKNHKVNILRSQSQPRDRQTFRTMAVKSINENTMTELGQKYTVDMSKTKVLGRKVMDLSISNDNIYSKFEISDVAVPLLEEEDDSVILSPYTQRVMRNLAKIYKESDDIKTPRGTGTVFHPWQHDRLLRSLSEESNRENNNSCCRCSCSNSIFSGNDDLIDFFLPLMGRACVCGTVKGSGLTDSDQPTSLVNILRPWQVTFLCRFGIYSGEELVKSFHRSGLALAKAMIKYRKNEGLTPYSLKSSVMALQIWSKTSKTFVRSIRDQLSQRNTRVIQSDNVHSTTTALKLPNTLYILSSFMDNVHEDDDVSEIAMQQIVRPVSTMAKA